MGGCKGTDCPPVVGERRCGRDSQDAVGGNRTEESAESGSAGGCCRVTAIARVKAKAHAPRVPVGGRRMGARVSRERGPRPVVVVRGSVSDTDGTCEDSRFHPCNPW